MKIKLYYIIIIISIGFSSCKKQQYETTQAFGTVNINNQSGVQELIFEFNGNTFKKGLSLTNLKIPVGAGNLRFLNPQNQQVLIDTNLSIKENETKELVLFKPDENSKVILLENNQASEQPPADGFMKVKIANFASNTLPNSVDVVLYGFDDSVGDYVPLDTIENVGPGFPDEYITVKGPTSTIDRAVLTLYLDPLSKETLGFSVGNINAFDFVSEKYYKVFTLYLKNEGASDITMNTLFFN